MLFSTLKMKIYLISSWSLFQVQSYLPLSIINYCISKHYAGSQVSDRCILGYLLCFSGGRGPDPLPPLDPIMESNQTKVSELLPLGVNLPFEPVHVISNNVVCVTSKASDQPAHTRSLIRAFACRLNIP